MVDRDTQRAHASNASKSKTAPRVLVSGQDRTVFGWILDLMIPPLVLSYAYHANKKSMPTQSFIHNVSL